MTEFYSWTRDAQICVTILLALCVLAQGPAMILSYYRRPYNRVRFFENMQEPFVLFQVIVLSLMHGQVMYNYCLTIITPAGYAALRYISVAAIITTVSIIIAATKKARTLPVIAISCLALPEMERLTGGAYAWFYISALFFWLARGVCICIHRYREINTGISALSIKNAIDSLHTGVLFSEPDGFVLLANGQIHRLMTILTGTVHRNCRIFYEALASGEFQDGCQKTEFEGHIVCLLPDQSAWMFTRTELQIRNKPYIQLLAADITERWTLTAQLLQHEDQLKLYGSELTDTIANLHILYRYH